MSAVLRFVSVFNISCFVSSSGNIVPLLIRFIIWLIAISAFPIAFPSSVKAPFVLFVSLSTASLIASSLSPSATSALESSSSASLTLPTASLIALFASSRSSKAFSASFDVPFAESAASESFDTLFLSWLIAFVSSSDDASTSLRMSTILSSESDKVVPMSLISSILSSAKSVPSSNITFVLSLAESA